MKEFYSFQHSIKNKCFKGVYFLRGDVKSEIFNSIDKIYSKKYFQFKKLWNFLVICEKNDYVKKTVNKNRKIDITFLNQKKIESEFGNILVFPEIGNHFKVQMKKIPIKFIPTPLYINFQYDINQKMRAILIDWLIDVHYKFKLVPTTLYLTVNSIDRFLSLNIMMRQKLQLLGISSMLLASKYEEIYAPETRDFVYISDNAYSKEDIFRMEILICTTLNYIFQIPSPVLFISEWSKILNASQEEIVFSSYTLELHLIEYNCIIFQNDIISVSSLLNSICLLNSFGEKLDVFKFFKKLSKNLLNFQNLRSCLSVTISLLVLNQNGRKKLTSLKRKYNHKKYKEVSEVTFFIYFYFN